LQIEKKALSKTSTIHPFPLFQALALFIIVGAFLPTKAQLEGRPAYQFTYQIDPSDLSNSPYQFLPQQQIVPQQQTPQQQQGPPANPPPPFINPSPNAYRPAPIEIPKTTTQQPPRENRPQNAQIQPSQPLPQEVPLQYFHQPGLFNFQAYDQEPTFDAKINPAFNSFAAPPLPIAPPPQQVPSPAYPQNPLQFDDLQQKLQLQLQITQQIQQQIEQLQKLQELNTRSITQQKKLLDEGKLNLARGSSSQGQQPVYQPVNQQNRQKIQADSQEIYTQHSFLPQSTTANRQFAPANALQRQPPRFVSPVFLENVTDPSLPYYLVAPSLNSVSFYDRLPHVGLEGRSFLPHTVDLTTAVPNEPAGTPPGIFGESGITATTGDVHTPTEVPNSSESTEQNAIETETVSAQRRSQSEVTTAVPRVPRERLQNSIRRFVARGQQRT